MWDILESTVQKTNKAYHQSVRDLADMKEKLKKVGGVQKKNTGITLSLPFLPALLPLPHFLLSPLPPPTTTLSLPHILSFPPSQVSHLDEVAMGSEERQELEAKIDDLEERVDECEKTQKDVFLTICQVHPISST